MAKTIIHMDATNVKIDERLSGTATRVYHIAPVEPSPELTELYEEFTKAAESSKKDGAKQG